MRVSWTPAFLWMIWEQFQKLQMSLHASDDLMKRCPGTKNSCQSSFVSFSKAGGSFLEITRVAFGILISFVIMKYNDGALKLLWVLFIRSSSPQNHLKTPLQNKTTEHSAGIFVLVPVCFRPRFWQVIYTLQNEMGENKWGNSRTGFLSDKLSSSISKQDPLQLLKTIQIRIVKCELPRYHLPISHECILVWDLGT